MKESAPGAGLKARPDSVRVSLQSRIPLPAVPKVERRRLLQARFQRLTDQPTYKAIEVDLDAISVSAQTVEATIPAGQLDELRDSLGRKGFRVDRVRVARSL